MTSTDKDLVNDFGEGQPAGSRHYRAWVGPSEYYDRIGALQFNTLCLFGLREYHALLDVGCGSLRGGRLFIMYLRPGNYYGIEPTTWALDEGKRAHLGKELLDMKRPEFSNDVNYTLTQFGRKFDYIVAHSVFTHAPANQISRCLLQAREVMDEKTIFIATYFEGKENYQGDHWVYPWTIEYTPAFIEHLVSKAGLKCTPISLPHPFDQRWLIIIDPANTTDFATLAEGSEFRYETYLKDEIVAFGGTRRTYAEYLRDDLAPRATDKRTYIHE